MAVALERSPVSYEALADLEREFDDAETEIIRQQVTLTQPLYTRRTKLVSQIENFWPLVLEQAPPDIDQYIQPSDSALLLSSLTSLSVSHFEISNGDPRSISIKWEFSPNEYFENQVLEKTFWYRRAKDGWSGLVSEPVNIRWKEGKDLTGGLLGLVCKVWEESKGERIRGKLLSEQQKALQKRIENTGMGGLSFFAWFGFIGRRISAEESAEATKADKEKRQARKSGEQASDAVDEEEDEDDEELDSSLEIFPDGDDLAIAISEDLWPGAIKYFTQAQEQDAISDVDFESDEEGQSEEDDEQSGRPNKIQRVS